jgi:acetoin utilization deacetylase AcuC-like enzyme
MMKVVFHEDFYQVYTGDPAAAPGRMEAIVTAIEDHVAFVPAEPATRQEIAAVHSDDHIQHVESQGVYSIASLAAGGAVQSARIGIVEPCFGLIRPPGHHASAGSAWGFCYFSNMAVALVSLYRQKAIQGACVLDIDLHFGDGTVNILDRKEWVTVINFDGLSREGYLADVEAALQDCRADLIGISAGFDNHAADWGGLLETRDYETIGRMVRSTADRNRGGCFGILEGGYNHAVLGENVLALIQGMGG